MKIKICHIVYKITGKADGVYAHLKMIFTYTDTSKYEHYLVFQGNPDIEKEFSDMGVKVYVMDALNKKFSFKMFTDFFLFIKRNNINIIQSHLLKPYVIAGLVNIFTRKNLIYNYHGLFIDTPYYNSLEKMIYKTAHWFICLLNSVDIAIVPSQEGKKLLFKETKLFHEIKFYYNGSTIDTKGKCNESLLKILLEKKKLHYLIGIVSRIEIQKRPDIAIEIIRGIIKLRDDINFIFMGDGPLEEEVKSSVRNYKLEPFVDVWGFVPNAKIYIKYFDLILLTSDWEGLPLTIWEAMAEGVPIVSTDVGGIKEILETENCGLLFPKGNVSEGIRIINNLIDDDKKKEIMRKKAIKAVQHKYTPESFADFFNKLYYELAHK